MESGRSERQFSAKGEILTAVWPASKSRTDWAVDCSGRLDFATAGLEAVYSGKKSSEDGASCCAGT
eukprot:224293-Pleurochrysis_carterae.AAC.6